MSAMHQSRPAFLKVAISPCPNDTYIFGSWVLGLGRQEIGIRASFVWADIDELNQGAMRRQWDVIKVSAAQALRLVNDYVILSSGGAFGLEHGPKLVARKPDVRLRTIAVPGLQTSAATLLRRTMEKPAELIPMRYDLIVHAVQGSRADAGLLIHESALLLERYGLHCLLDLGQWWRELTGGLPLPLGCILGRRSLGKETLDVVERQIRASIEHASEHPQAVMPLIAALAQEVDATVINAHIDAYVNDFSLDMGQKGRRALERFGALTATSGPA